MGPSGLGSGTPWSARGDRHFPFDNADSRAGCFAVDVELRADRAHSGAVGVDDERSRLAFGDMEERLTLQEVDVPCVVVVSNANPGIRVEVDARTVRKVDDSLFADVGAVNAVLGI